jgi:hypothetical protein
MLGNFTQSVGRRPARHHADRRSFAHQRNAENRAIATDLLARAICIFGIRQMPQP